MKAIGFVVLYLTTYVSGKSTFSFFYTLNIEQIEISAFFIERTRSPFVRPLIVGGTEVHNFSQFAYQLSLQRNGAHICGASIIATQWALSGRRIKILEIHIKSIPSIFTQGGTKLYKA
jgi:hypothetical protein